MADFTVTVRDNDVATLEQLAQREWRTAPMQLCAIVEAAIANARARANTAPRTAPRRTPARSNGAVRAEA